MLWMADCYFSPNTTPMWVGWNSKMFPDEVCSQKVWYLPQINESPTSVAVVAETMRRAQRIAEECKKKSISVTYDLAIAKIALQLQEQESPRFDNVFVALGAFHVKMAAFCIFGKYIAESGGPYILNECHVVEKGSLKSFLSGKGYKRSKRVHQLLALAMEILHFKSFLQTQQDMKIAEQIQSELTTLHSDDRSEHEVSKEVDDIMNDYFAYVHDTENGKHGLTAQYWLGYIKMIQLYHTFIRSIRTGDLQLYIYCLPLLANYFFTFNHPNYARWLVRYHDNLLKLKDTHPEVHQEFENGADAACQRKGIVSLTNSISARQRWAQSHFIRTSIISQVFEDLGMTKKEDVSQDLRTSQIKRNSKDLCQIMSLVKDTMNPFSTDINKEHLFNIGSGKSATEDTSKFLLNVVSTGCKARERFIEECVEDPKRFERPIRRVKLHTFGNEGGKYKIRGKDNKLVAVSMMRDLFGSILFLSLEKKVDTSEVLTYPLTPVPLSLCHTDGTMQKTSKVKLLHELESRIKTVDPSRVDVLIIDGMFFLHLLFDLPATFGMVAKFIFNRICTQKSHQIHLVFDKTVSPSIKDCERDSRASNRSAAYYIAGPEQKRPSNWLAALRNDQFKESLVDFLVISWDDKSQTTTLGVKKVFVNCKDNCYYFKVQDGKMMKMEETTLHSTHEEADSRMIFHLSSVVGPANVVVRTSDTYVLIFALGCMANINPEVKVWLEVGLYTKNTLRYISVSQLYTKLGEKLCKSLPAHHAFLGCDYTASFNRKGKVRPLKVLEKNPTWQEIFGGMGVNNNLNDINFAEIEKYVCTIYGKKQFSSVDEVRLDMFLKKYKPKGINATISCVKKMDGSYLPPCSRTVCEKVRRTNYIAGIWMSSTMSSPPDRSPVFRMGIERWTISNQMVRW